LFLVPFGQVVVFYLLGQAGNMHPSQLGKHRLDVV
ncbi:hypothetical protein MNBD_CHLOROFLEXI01-3171, partial [hydrothermal vent metagenome]